MKFQISALAVAAALLVTACGGGGGGGTTAATATPTAVTPPVVVVPASTLIAVSTATAKAIASSAVDATANSVPLAAPLGLINVLNVTPTANSFTTTRACTSGGSAVLVGTIATTVQLSAGDRFLTTFSNCGVASVYGGTLALTGTSNSTILAYSSTILSASAVIDKVSLTFLGIANELSGDQRADIELTTPTTTTSTLSGKTMTITATRASGVRKVIFQDYRQSISGPSTLSSCTTTATIQTNNPNIGPLGGSFVLTTLAPVVRNNSNGQLVSGSVKIVGASNAALLATVNADGTTTIQIDANGDGFYESSVTTNAIELAALL